MPNIREYTNKIDKLTPSDKGTGAMADLAQSQATAGYRSAQMIRGAGNEIGGAISESRHAIVNAREAFVVQPELSKGAALGVGLTADLTREWNEIASKADVNDNSIAEKFRVERLEPAIEKFRSGFQTSEGQKWADKFGNNVTEHMNNRFMTDGAARAGAAVKSNFEKMENDLSTAAIADPTNMKFLMKTAEDGVKTVVGSTPGLTPEMGAKLGTQLLQSMQKTIAQSTIVAMGQKNPDAAIKAIERGDFKEWLNGSEELKYLQQMKRLNTSEARAARQERRDTITDNANKASNGIVLSTITPDGQIRIPANYFKAIHDQFGDLTEANPAMVRALIEYGEKELNRDRNVKIATDPEVYSSLSNDLVAGTLTLEKLLKAKNAQTLSNENFNELHANMNALKNDTLNGEGYKASLDAAKASLTYAMPGLPGKDPKGLANYAGFLNRFTAEYMKAKSSGNLQANALDVNDPSSLISQTMAPYKRSSAQIIADRMAEMTNSSQPINSLASDEAIRAVPKNLQQARDRGDLVKNADGVYYDLRDDKYFDKTGKEIKKDGK